MERGKGVRGGGREQGERGMEQGMVGGMNGARGGSEVARVGGRERGGRCEGGSGRRGKG